MAEQDNNLKDQKTPEILEDSLSKTEVLLEENKDVISKVLIGIAIVIAGYFGYNNMFAEPAEQAAFEEIWPAQKMFEQQLFDSASTEFEYILENHGGTKAGNLAGLYLGISQLQSGKFDEALNSLESFDAEGKLSPGLKVGLIGDCHSELGDVDKAVANYKKAASLLDSKGVSPYYLKKAGILLEQNGKSADAVEVYELALNTYLSVSAPSVESVKIEMEMLLARAKASK